MQKIKQAVILCAGLGTRLRPLTNTIPKPMLPIMGKPMLLWNIEHFKKYGITDFKINLHYLPDVIRNYFGDGAKFGVRIEYNFEKEILGTAGALDGLRNSLGDIFFLIYGDTISFIDYGAMAEEFFALAKPIGMQRVERTDAYSDADIAELDAQKKFVAVHPKPHAGAYANVYRMKGIFIFRKKVLDYVVPKKYAEIGRDLLPALVENGENFYGYECAGFSKGIDTIEKLKEAEEYIRRNHLV
jgi:NDP-sugar pyrophosphorylase family protein